ncbi:MAG: AAA family ATPase [Magnetococcales bacterium]|nr:AAA family ATPase [Magnetococcales bacterium]
MSDPTESPTPYDKSENQAHISRLISDADRAEIESLRKKLNSILLLGTEQTITGASRSSYLQQEGGGFTEITIHKFRRLNNIEIKNLCKINLIAGVNNSGKTTLLEAVKLLSGLNHSEEFINLVRSRAKTSSEQVDIQWFIDQLPNGELSGTFANKTASLKLEIEDIYPEDMTQYLKSIYFDVTFNEQSWHSVIHFFEKYPRKTKGEFVSICPSVFSSPFSGLEPKLLNDCYDKSLAEGSKQLIIDFIRSHIDPMIINIEKNSKGHFTVIHKKISPNPDITMFGEGLQRIFKIGLLFAGAKNGVVIIDELENAIHAGLLPKLTTLIYNLAIQFNSQVFISSHSKECIDAFAMNEEIPKTDISGHSLFEKDRNLICRSFSGERLSALIENIDFDLRGGLLR